MHVNQDRTMRIIRSVVVSRIEEFIRDMITTVTWQNHHMGLNYWQYNQSGGDTVPLSRGVPRADDTAYRINNQHVLLSMLEYIPCGLNWRGVGSVGSICSRHANHE